MNFRQMTKLELEAVIQLGGNSELVNGAMQELLRRSKRNNQLIGFGFGIGVMLLGPWLGFEIGKVLVKTKRGRRFIKGRASR